MKNEFCRSPLIFLVFSITVQVFLLLRRKQKILFESFVFSTKVAVKHTTKSQIKFPGKIFAKSWFVLEIEVKHYTKRLLKIKKKKIFESVGFSIQTKVKHTTKLQIKFLKKNFTKKLVYFSNRGITSHKN